jgi:hypothetical protein
MFDNTLMQEISADSTDLGGCDAPNKTPSELELYLMEHYFASVHSKTGLTVLPLLLRLAPKHLTV